MRTVEDYVNIKVEICKGITRKFKGIPYKERAGFVDKLIKENESLSELVDQITENAYDEIVNDIVKVILANNTKTEELKIKPLERKLKQLNETLSFDGNKSDVNIDKKSIKAQIVKVENEIIKFTNDYCPNIRLKEFPFLTKSLINNEGKFTGFKEQELVVESVELHGSWLISKTK